jgi:putative ABC transport system permease protein
MLMTGFLASLRQDLRFAARMMAVRPGFLRGHRAHRALGAQRGSILAMVLRQGLRLAITGIAIGIAGAAVLTRLLNSMLFGVKALDMVTFTLAAMLFVMVALAASYIPARRAAAIEPLAALRNN